MHNPNRPRALRLGTLTVLLLLSACGTDTSLTSAPPDGTTALDETVAWRHAPRNGRLAFSRFSEEMDAWVLYSSQPDGSDVQQLTVPEHSVFDDLVPDWSPDGATIVFAREYLADGSRQFYRVNADGSNLTQLTHCSGECLGIADPAWSPDGRRIAFAEANGNDAAFSVGIWVMSADGGNARQVTQRREPSVSEDQRANWSPDGRRIAFSRFNTVAQPVGKQAVFVSDLDGTDVRRITPWQLNASASDWSPDGTLILLTTHYDVEPSGNEQLYTVHPDGSGLTRVIPSGLSQPSSLEGKFSPDGRKIVFKRANDPYPVQQLYTMNLDGSNVALISSPEFGYANPAWGTHR